MSFRDLVHEGGDFAVRADGGSYALISISEASSHDIFALSLTGQLLTNFHAMLTNIFAFPSRYSRVRAPLLPY